MATGGYYCGHYLPPCTTATSDCTSTCGTEWCDANAATSYSITVSPPAEDEALKQEELEPVKNVPGWWEPAEIREQAREERQLMLVELARPPPGVASLSFQRSRGDAMDRDPKRTGVKATRVSFPDDPCYPDHAEPGQIDVVDYTVAAGVILLACPGCGHVTGMHVGFPKPASSPSWKIDAGSLAAITTLTLSPSINCVGCCGWHGWLKNGVFESC